MLSHAIDLLGPYWRNQSGATAAIMAVAIVALVGITGFAVDLGHAFYVQRSLQASTDAAALAGAYEIANGAAISTARAFSAASVSSTANPVPNVTVPLANVSVSLKCFATLVSNGQDCIAAPSGTGDVGSEPAGGAANGIAVTQTATFPTYFLRILGISTLSVATTSNAGGTGGLSPGATGPAGGPLDVMIVLDTVGGNPVLSANLGNPLTYLSVGASDPASLADAPNAPCRMNTVPGSNGNVLTETIDYTLALLGLPLCTASGGSKISTALAGIQTLLKALPPCAPTLSSCGAATNGNVANPYAEVGLMVFPGFSNSTQAQYDYETGTCSGATQPAIIAYHLSPTYQVVPLSSDYRTSDSTTNLNSASNMALAAGGAGGCGAWAVNPTSFSLSNPTLDLLYGSYYAAAITAAQTALANDGRTHARKVIIFLSDGNADALSGIASVGVLNGGSGYTNGANVTISGGMGSGAQATATVVNGVVTAVTLTNPGSGYSSVTGGTNATISPKPTYVLGVPLPGPGSGAVLTVGLYPGLNQCQQGIAAAQAATNAGTQVYSIAYGASNLTLLPPAVTCLTDVLATSACQAMQTIASDPTKFYAVNINGSACASAKNSQADLTSIFKAIAANLAGARLLPPNTT
jgi:Flp pilus assembly protein TadG